MEASPPESNPDPESTPQLWRSDNLLIAAKGAVFPLRCLKTNQPTEQFSRHFLYWNHPALLLVFLLVCLCGPVGLALALISLGLGTRKASLNLPFAPGILSIRRKRLLSIMTACAALCAFFPLAHWLNHFWPVLAGVIGLLCVSLVASVYMPLVTVQEIRGEFISIHGVCPEFLNELPEFHREDTIRRKMGRN